jgi:hypothetical protein
MTREMNDRMTPSITNERGRTAATASSHPADVYERPEVVDYGSLQELTLSGSMPLSDTFGGSAGGGS